MGGMVNPAVLIVLHHTQGYMLWQHVRHETYHEQAVSLVLVAQGYHACAGLWTNHLLVQKTSPAQTNLSRQCEQRGSAAQEPCAYCMVLVNFACQCTSQAC